MLSYRATLDVPSATARTVARWLSAHRRAHDVRPHQRAATCWVQAVMLLRWLIEATAVAALAREGLSSFLCKWCGLQVGVDAFGVGQGELLEGLFPVGGHGSLDESPRGSSLVGW